MHKTAFVVLAALSLSACASLAPMTALNTAPPLMAKVSVEAAVDCDEPVVVTDPVIEASGTFVIAASPPLERRAFGYPTRRQPELRLVLATALDRQRFYPRRRRRRRAKERCCS